MPAGAGSSKTLSYTPRSLGVGQKRVDLGLSREGKEQRVGLRRLTRVIAAWVRRGLQSRGH